jgi:hypothetical protein
MPPETSSAVDCEVEWAGGRAQRRTSRTSKATGMACRVETGAVTTTLGGSAMAERCTKVVRLALHIAHGDGGGCIVERASVRREGSERRRSGRDVWICKTPKAKPSGVECLVSS